MSNILSINDLEFKNDPKLIFTANTPTRKGLAFKTYTITIPNTSRNNGLLSNVFGVNIFKPTYIPATYTVEGRLLRGNLIIQSVTKKEAKAVFGSGNAFLWERIGADLLTMLDLSEYDMTLTKANVIASESGNPFVVYDLTDRGAFSSDRNIDITDRFPALNVKQLLTKIFNTYGTGVEYNEFAHLLDDKYLLFTQNDAIRNSAQWVKDAYFRAYTQNSLSYTRTLTADGIFEVDNIILLPEDKDIGNNYTPANGKYLVPETGTYNFISNYNIRVRVPVNVNISGPFLYVSIYRNGVELIRKTHIPNFAVDKIAIYKDSIQSYPVELTAGDEITLRCLFSGYSDGAGVFLLEAFDTEIYNITSRWYGAGSTVEISKILPSMNILEFIKAVCETLNINIYYNDITNQVTLETGRNKQPAGSVQIFDYDTSLEKPNNILINQQSDKAAPVDNAYINIVGIADVELKLPTARTYVGSCVRLFNEATTQIPVLWESGDPKNSAQTFLPPARKTTAAMRIVQKVEPTTGSYTLTYGGILIENSEVITSILQLRDIDTFSVQVPSLSLVNEIVEGYASFDVNKLADMTYFKQPLMLVDLQSGIDYALVYLLQVEQSSNKLFKFTAQIVANYTVDTTDKSRKAEDKTINATGTSGGSSTAGGSSSGGTPYILPADVWRTSIASQISGMTAKTYFVDADNFVIDDSSAGNLKKKVSWATIKTALSSFFYGSFSGQFFATSEKTSITNNDIFIIEDSESATAFSKKKTKWVTIKSTLKTYFDTLYKVWVIDTYGITTDSRVGIKGYSAATHSLTVYDDDGNYNGIKVITPNRDGIEIASGGKGLKSYGTEYGGKFESPLLPLQAEIIDGNTNTSVSVLKLTRKTTGTAASGIGEIILFEIQNSTGSLSTTSFIQSVLTDATSGKAELRFGNNSTVRAKINGDNDFEFSPGTDIVFSSNVEGVILRSPSNTKYRIKVSDAGVLSTEIVT